MAEDLSQTIRSLSPGALTLFKRQLQGLPEKDRRLAYSRLQGIPELSDLLGRTPQEDVIAKLPAQPKPVQQAQPKPSLGQIMGSRDIPLWQKGLAGFGAPFQWLQERAIEPFAAAMTSPFTPSVARTEGKSWLERERAEYEQWQEPEFTMPWGGKFRPTKGAVEFLPWLAVPGIGGVAGKGGMVAGRGIAGALGRLGTAGKVAGTALEYSPWGLAEKAAGKAIGVAGKAARKALPKKVTPVTPEVTKPIIGELKEWFGIAKEGDRIIGILPDGTPLKAQGIGAFQHRGVGTAETWLDAGVVRIVPEEGGVNTIEIRGNTTSQQKIALNSLIRGSEKVNIDLTDAAGKILKSIYGEPDMALRELSSFWKVTPTTPAVAIPKAEVGMPKGLRGLLTPEERAIYNRLPPEGKLAWEQEHVRLGLLTPTTVKPTATAVKITSEMFPEGLPEEQSTAVDWLTGLVKKSKPITKETLELRKPEHAQRFAEYERLIQRKVVAGEPITQVEEAAITTQALSGAYSTAPLTPAFLKQLQELGKYEATLAKMVATAPFELPGQRRNAFEAFWSLLNEGRLQMNQIQTLERVFGSEFAKAALSKHRTLGQKIWFHTVDAINIPRGLLSMGDLSGFGRQGWILTTTRPGEAVKAFVPMVGSMLSDKNAVFMDNVFLNRPHINKVLRLRPDFLTKWAGEATDIVAREEGFASRWLNKVPGLSHIYKGSTRAYTTVLNDLRTANVSAAISGWEKKGFKYLTLEEAGKMFGDNAAEIFKARFYTDNDISLLARTVSWASGRGSLPPELARHAGIANAVLFAPKLIASRVEFPLAVLPFVTPSRLARGEAMRELLSFLGTGVGILGMAQLSGAAKIELDMRSPDFGKMKAGDVRLDIWTGYSQYMRFIAQMATAQGKTESGRITAKDRNNLIWRFAQSKLSPAAGFINDWISGETYLGEDMPPKSTKGVFWQMYQRAMPLAIQDLVDGYLEDSWSGGLISSAGIFGVGVVTYTDEVSRTRDKVAKQKYGVTWDEVGQKYGKVEQLKLEQASPAIKEAVEEHENRFAAGTPSTMDTFRSMGKTVEETYRKDIDNAVREFQETSNGVLFRKKVEDATKARRKSYATRTKMPEFQDIIAYYQQPLDAKALAKLNPNDVLRREYYQQLFDPVAMYDKFGNYLFEEAERREQAFIIKYGQQAMDYIEEYQTARWVDKPVELKALEQARELLRPYWKIEEQIWSMYPKGLQEISEQIQLWDDQGDPRGKQTLRQYPMILRARQLIATYKKQMREINPMIQQARRLYYG